MFPAYTLDLVLEMSVSAFFCLLKNGRRLHAYRLAETCDIHVIANQETKYYHHLKSHYMKLATDHELLPYVEEEVASRPAMDSGSTEAKDFFFGLFGAMKGIN